jgi:threonine/homoserine/homoserine lactone efflux protein
MGVVPTQLGLEAHIPQRETLEMSYSFFLALGMFALNVLTPGASFFMTISNAMKHGRLSGFLIALGLATADTMFAVMATAGLAALVSQDVVLMKFITLFGGMWFVYKGLRLILQRKAAQLPVEAEKTKGALPVSLAYRMGFTSGAVNPQPIIFFSAVFTYALMHSTGGWQESLSLVAGVALVSAVIRCSIVRVFTTKIVMDFYAKHCPKVETFSGAMLAIFGLKLAGPAAMVLTQALLN